MLPLPTRLGQTPLRRGKNTRDHGTAISTRHLGTTWVLQKGKIQTALVIGIYYASLDIFYVMLFPQLSKQSLRAEVGQLETPVSLASMNFGEVRRCIS